MDEETLRILAEDRNFRRYLVFLALDRLYVAIMNRQRGLLSERS